MREVKQLFGIGSMSQGLNLNSPHFFPYLFPPAAHFFLTLINDKMARQQLRCDYDHSDQRSVAITTTRTKSCRSKTKRRLGGLGNGKMARQTAPLPSIFVTFRTPKKRTLDHEKMAQPTDVGTRGGGQTLIDAASPSRRLRPTPTRWRRLLHRPAAPRRQAS